MSHLPIRNDLHKEGMANLTESKCLLESEPLDTPQSSPRDQPELAARGVSLHGEPRPQTGRFIRNGVLTTLSLSSDGLDWRQGSQRRRLALVDVVGVSAESSPEGCCSGRSGPELCLHSFERSRKRTTVWKPVQYRFQTETPETVLSWVEAVRSYLHALPDRPKRLWVFINPFGGSKRALKIWKRKVQPLFSLAGIVSEVVITTRANEAFDCLQAVAAEKLQSFDGLIAVGGDGLFQEVMNGLLTATTPSKPSLRIGHVPAGSTDAVAWSLNGSRDPSSAALRIILGDRMTLDVMHIQSDSQNCRKYSACIAGYGFMGDIVSMSENLRWCGPVRYDLAGAAAFLSHHTHRARVSYVRAAPLENNGQECTADCLWCQNKLERGFSLVDSLKLAQSKIEVLEGSFVSIMVTVMPCRSDKSPNGLIPHAHLSDGRLHVTLVKQCSRLSYLQFLIGLSRKGVLPDKHDFVETVDASWVRVEPLDGQSSWSIDGEILTDQTITSVVHGGLVEVFARGVEPQKHR